MRATSGRSSSWLSDGKDSGQIDFRQRAVSQVDVIERARRDDVMIYAVGMRSRGGRQQTPGIGQEGLRTLMLADLPDPGLARVAEETGGGQWRSASVRIWEPRSNRSSMNCTASI